MSRKRTKRKKSKPVDGKKAEVGGDGWDISLHVPPLPKGEHLTACPLCKNAAKLVVAEDNSLAIANAAAEPQKVKPSTRGSKFDFSRYREHPAVIRARMYQRRGKKTIVMLGTHARSAPLAPFTEAGIDEFWALNDSHALGYIKANMHRITRWFQLHHRWRFTRRVTRRSEDHWAWLRQDHGDLKIYMQRKFADVPNSVAYPIRDVCDEFIKDLLPRGAGYVQQYFTNTFSYAFALVLYEKVKGINDWERIELYGCELEQIEHEYFRQRPGLEWWMGMLAAHGIQIYVPTECRMLYAQDIQGGQLYQYPGYMAYGYKSPSLEEARRLGLPVGEDQVEENVLGIWEDAPIDFVTATNREIWADHLAGLSPDWVADVKKLYEVEEALSGRS